MQQVCDAEAGGPALPADLQRRPNGGAHAQRGADGTLPFSAARRLAPHAGAGTCLTHKVLPAGCNRSLSLERSVPGEGRLPVSSTKTVLPVHNGFAAISMHAPRNAAQPVAPGSLASSVGADKAGTRRILHPGRVSSFNVCSLSPAGAGLVLHPGHVNPHFLMFSHLRSWHRTRTASWTPSSTCPTRRTTSWT